MVAWLRTSLQIFNMGVEPMRLQLTMLFAAILASATYAKDLPEGFIAQSPNDIEWQDVPQLPGLSAALITGNPETQGLYIMRAKFGPGVKSPPHHHDQDRFVSVISGTWSFGVGEDFTCDNTVPLEAGSYAVHPRGAVHFDGSCGEEVIVEITGMGPVKTEFVGQANE